MKKEEKKKQILDFNELAVYNFVKKFIKKNTYAPSVMEISEATHIPKTTVQDALKRLKHSGHITMKKNVARSIVIPGYLTVVEK